MKKILLILIGLIVLVVLITAVVPSLRERVLYHADRIMTIIFYKLNPPEEAVFVPNTPEANITVTQLPTHTATSTLEPTNTPETPEDTATPQPTNTPLPDQVYINGITYVDQHLAFNYCAPANLAMMLNYWGVEVPRNELGTALKPYAEDYNVMPYEMADFVSSETELQVKLRTGGTTDLLKELTAGGFPVLLETGRFMVDVTGKLSWMGHYTVVVGYDDAEQHFITYDSYYEKDYTVSYEELEQQWRAFNFTFLVVYSPDNEGTINNLLGPYAVEADSDRIAYDKATEEVWNLDGVDQYFAWFNRGTSMVALGDYYGAAESFDEAFAVYEALSESDRPYRMMWYQTGPYFAYYYTGRYQDVIDLATFTLDNARLPIIEESYYWRGLAETALGQFSEAHADFCSSLQYHNGFQPALQALADYGFSECP